MSKPKSRYTRENYWRALGEFIDRFAIVEVAIHLLLQERTKTHLEIARAVYSGVRMQAAMGLLNRLSQVLPLPEDRQHDQEHIFAQLGIITRVRNLILHYGAGTLSGPEEWFVDDWLTAINDEQITRIKISVPILSNLIHDLRKINVHLSERHLWREPGLMSPYEDELHLLHEPWRYKLPEQGSRRRKPRGTTPKRSRPH